MNNIGVNKARQKFYNCNIYKAIKINKEIYILLYSNLKRTTLKYSPFRSKNSIGSCSSFFKFKSYSKKLKNIKCIFKNGSCKKPFRFNSKGEKGSIEVILKVKKTKMETTVAHRGQEDISIAIWTEMFVLIGNKNIFSQGLRIINIYIYIYLYPIERSLSMIEYDYPQVSSW